MNLYEIDVQLAEKVMGWYLQDQMVLIATGQGASGYFDKSGLLMYEKDWHPTRDIAQAFMVVDKMRELGFMMKLGYGDTIQGVLCWVKFTSESYSSYYHNINPAEAISRAALAAVGGGE